MHFGDLALAVVFMLQVDQGELYKLTADVERVVLPVSVQARNGELVAGLSQRDFLVLEDGRPQQILGFSSLDVPITIGLVVDASASMRGKRAETVLAALHLVRLSNPQDQVFVINFNEKVTLGLPSGVLFSSDSNELIAALNSSPATGRTALYDAVAEGIERLRPGLHDKKALIVVSDGGDNASMHTLAQVVDLATKSGAIIYTIGFHDEQDQDWNPAALTKLARVTGGEAFVRARLREIRDICARIAHDLRSQYTISYKPSGESGPGVYHRVRVVVTVPEGKRFSVRTRPGYYYSPPDRLAGSRQGNR